MILIYIFFALYLVCLSIIADRYHKNLRKISILQMALKHPMADKQVLWKKNDEAVFILKKQKKLSYWVLVGLAVIHQIAGFIVSFNGSHSRLELNVCYVSPIIAVVISFVILAIIFWLKGKGGGVPRNSVMEKSWPSSF